MSVDMFERRFRQELERLPRFIPDDNRTPEVWQTDFPAWRALFSSLCLFGHSTGYRLPSFENFFKYCKNAYTLRHPARERFERYFTPPLEQGMRQRIAAWYESGMAEAYLYACLVEALEDKAKCGLVLYDPRADWKLKADMIVIVGMKPNRISAYVGHQSDRPAIEAHRDALERERKRNTMESAHWHNSQLAQMPVYEISRTKDDLQVVNGLRLFSIRAINHLLEVIYSNDGSVKQPYYFPANE